MADRPGGQAKPAAADAPTVTPALRVVGQPVVRHDARDKVAAATAYAAGLLRLSRRASPASTSTRPTSSR